MELSTLNPERIEKIRSEIQPILAKVAEVSQIVDASSEERAVEFLAQVKRRIKLVDDARTFLVKPLNDHVKEINATFKDTLAPLEEAYDAVRRAASAYRSSEDMKEAQRAKAAMIEEAKTAVEEGDTAKLENLAAGHAEIEAAAPQIARSRTGSMSTRMDWKFEITGPDSVPRNLCMPDPRLIREAVRNGMRQIPGVRIWEEAVPIIRS